MHVKLAQTLYTVQFTGPVYCIMSTIQDTVRCRHTQTVKDRSSSYKIDFVIVIKNFLNPNVHQNPKSGSKVTAILLKGGICIMVELQRGKVSDQCGNVSSYFD